MAEPNEEEEKRCLRELEGKNIAHYSVLLQAWIQTRMERDKTIVTLSAAGLGLLVTILTTVGVIHAWLLLLFVGAIVGFVTSISASLVIYQLNSQHIEHALRGSSERDPRLERYDKTSFRAFLLGAGFSAALGVASAIGQLIETKGDSSMASKETGKSQISKPTTLRESVNGAGQLSPSELEQRSLNGVTNLNPQAVHQPTATQQQSTAPQQSNQGSGGDANSTNPGQDKK
jgi:hypothetical protein